MLFPRGTLPKGPKVDVQKALLLLDLQNDFVAPDGKLPVPNISDFLPKVPNLANSFRSKGSVIWVQTEYDQPRLTVSPETGFSTLLLQQHLNEGNNSSGPLFQSLIQHDPEAFLDRSYPSNDVRPCISGTSGAQMADGLASTVDSKADIMVVKSDYSAFSNTQLLIQLRTRMITHLYVCGSLSNVSVYATVLDAVRHGLEITLVEDCLGFLSEKCHFEAVRQMADDMGASGIDYQELMDDLAGLLGDIIKEESFKTRFQVTQGPPSGPKARTPVPSAQRQERVEDWIESAGSKRRQPTAESPGTPSKSEERGASESNESQPRTKVSKVSSQQGTPEVSPPRKRSTSDLDNQDDDPTPQPPPRSSTKLDSPRPLQKAKPRLRNTRSSQESSNRPVSTSLKPLLSKSTGDIPNKLASSMISDSGSDRPSIASPLLEPTVLPQPKKQKKSKTAIDVLGPTDIIGTGDSRLITNVIDTIDADAIFHELKETIQWQKMYHRSGEVPRLVAVQGHVSEDGNEIPIYRHPADESPALLAFSPTINMLRQICEKHTGHPLNHVLIQWYRSGEDNISEHSDKTLDIVRGSSIVNLSFGAQRTMTLRTKKPPQTNINSLTAATLVTEPQQTAIPSTLMATSIPETEETTTTPTFMPQAQPQPQIAGIPPRSTQRIPLPHSSLFILGPLTNTSFLHSIRADKRPLTEKSPAELAFEQHRISLTFRHIGTFINTESNIIWGQGATGKKREEAKPILTNAEAGLEGEKMIRTFGVENHSGEKDWDWEQWYGTGFDCVDFDGHETASTKAVGEIMETVAEG